MRRSAARRARSIFRPRSSPRRSSRISRNWPKVTDCVRTYSVDFGLDQVPEIAQRHGLKVLLGLWVSSHADRTQYQISTGVALAKRFPDVVRAVIVGNEALLRGEVSPATLGRHDPRRESRGCKMPVTYADVWEFWLRYRELASAVDFVTIHILPYWEDDPVAARGRRRSRRCDPQARGRKFSRQGDRDRRGRLAERRPHARGRAAVAGQSGARHGRRAGARQARALPRQRDRGVRSAVEARAGGHRRRPLGTVRRRDARGRNSPGASRFRTIRIGPGRPRAASCWRRWCSRRRSQRGGAHAMPRRSTSGVWLRLR